jgi:hypothetical protein
MSKPHSLLVFVLVVAVPLIPPLAQGQLQWFVLRNHEVGNCWAATLVRIDGQYSSTFEQKAGGPYETEKEALDRIEALEVEGTCQ